MRMILVVDHVEDWAPNINGLHVVSSKEYLTNPTYQSLPAARVINLCGSYVYQHSGYYVSLLASARGQKVVPSVATILDIKSQSLLKIRSQSLEELIQKSLKDIRPDVFDLSIYFGKNLAKKYGKLAKELHKNFNSPLIRAKFVRKEKWRLQQITPIGLKEVPISHKRDLERFAEEYLTRRIKSLKLVKAKFNLAILVDPKEKLPPSNERAIKKFVSAAAHLGIDSELITKDDFKRLAEFDGLFIRVTTAVNHYTYRFAQKAEALGLVVIDDPESILRCTNKVYLAEVFAKQKIKAPKTLLIHKENLETLIGNVTLPAVLKKPDSSFSQGVIKATTPEELRQMLTQMLENSDLIVVQEFVPTEFDWRIGILDGVPLYACKYFMAKNHWQIYKKDVKGNVVAGQFETLPIEAIEPKLLKLATKAASAIGGGFYGLDIKEYKGKYYVIEINDNPSIDHGCEDKHLKDKLYERIILHFLKEMERRVLGVSQ